MPDRLWPPGVLRIPVGTCPGCGLDSHPGTTCRGLTSKQVIAALWPGRKLSAERDPRG